MTKYRKNRDFGYKNQADRFLSVNNLNNFLVFYSPFVFQPVFFRRCSENITKLSVKGSDASKTAAERNFAYGCFRFA